MSKDSRVEFLKRVIERRNEEISRREREIGYLTREIDRLKSRPFWRFWND